MGLKDQPPEGFGDFFEIQHGAVVDAFGFKGEAVVVNELLIIRRGRNRLRIAVPRNIGSAARHDAVVHLFDFLIREFGYKPVVHPVMFSFLQILEITIS